MYTICVAQLSNDKGVWRAISVFPAVGERFKFVPDGSPPPTQPGLYLLVGRYQSGEFQGRSWRRLVGAARAVSLADAEKILASAIQSLKL